MAIARPPRALQNPHLEQPQRQPPRAPRKASRELHPQGVALQEIRNNALQNPNIVRRLVFDVPNVRQRGGNLAPVVLFEN